MNERLAQLFGQLKEIWHQMPPKRRVLLGSAVGAVFVVLILMSFSLGGFNQRAVLFSHLGPTDAAEVLRQLEERGIRYSLQQHFDGRATILVPSNVVHRTRIDMAAMGLPAQGSVGFEIFDETQLGMTDDVRRINLRRALNGELERTIRAMDVVQDARVQVALPENRLFISQQVEPTAAVMLTLMPGSRLGAGQVQAIQRLVSATVEGLTAENVFVVDNRGNPLSDQLAQLSAPNGMSSVEQQLLIQQAVSNEYSRQVRALLEGPFGVGAVEAMVMVEINFERAEEIIKAFEAPNGRTGIIRSEQRFEEGFEGSGAPAGEGVPGVESNIPGYVGIIPTGDSEYFRSEQTINYEINQTERRREIPPGAVRRVSVAVLIDGELTEAQKTSVASTLTTALGLDLERGDRVHVDALPFVARPAIVEAAPDYVAAPWNIPTQYLWVIAGVLLLLILLWRAGRRREVPQRAPSGVNVIIDDDGIQSDGGPAEPLSEDEQRRKQMEDRVISAAKEDPDSVARLLKTWLTEE